MHKNVKLIGAVAVAGVVAATGSAFTNSNTGAGTSNQVGGYNAASVTGVAVTNVVYDYSTDRATIEVVTYTPDATGVPTTSIAEVSYDGGTTWVACAARTLVSDPIVCSLNQATTAVTSMNLVVREADSTAV